MTLKSANLSENSLGKHKALSSYQHLPHSGFTALLCLIPVVRFSSGILSLPWCWCAHREKACLSLKHPVLLVQALCLRQGSASTSQLALCLPHSDSAVTQACAVIQLSSRMEGLGWATLRWISFETPWESLVPLSRERFYSRFPLLYEKKILFGAENSLEKIFPFSNRLSWIFAFWLFQFTVSALLFTEVLQFTIINLQTVNSVCLIEHIWNWIDQSVWQYIGT